MCAVVCEGVCVCVCVDLWGLSGGISSLLVSSSRSSGVGRRLSCLLLLLRLHTQKMPIYKIDTRQTNTEQVGQALPCVSGNLCKREREKEREQHIQREHVRRREKKNESERVCVRHRKIHEFRQTD